MHRLNSERGFTLAAGMMIMFIILLLTVAAFAAANGDLRLTSRSGATKDAFSAAEAGIADYASHLNQDPNYWSLCTNVPSPSGRPTAVNQPWSGTGNDPRVWRTVPGSKEQYTIELLPASGTTCDTTKPETSMIDATSGTFRIRTTGRPSPTSTVKRSIITTFRRNGFLDFLYYTNYEDQDPTVFAALTQCYESSGTNPPSCYSTSGPSIAEWAGTQCEKYWRDGRHDTAYSGTYDLGDGNGSHQYPSNYLYCPEINFVTGDTINGPFHTNDGILVCGTPRFGRDSNDEIEISAAANQNPDEEPWRGNGGCSGNAPNFTGDYQPGSPILTPPPSNAQLKQNADLTYNGSTKIVLNSGGTMTVTNNGTTSTVSQPANGVVFVTGSGCATTDPYGGASGPNVYDGTAATQLSCGDLSISGTYSQNLTFGADHDIVITGSLTKSGDYLLGLIANGFVRIAHPAHWDSSGPGSPGCVNDGTSVNNISIQAAILALKNSFMVDRYFCGASLGTLNFTGALAQNHRGTVGATINGGNTGFIKNYNYDDRLRFRSPPHFLDPVDSAWKPAREIEQVPAR